MTRMIRLLPIHGPLLFDVTALKNPLAHGLHVGGATKDSWMNLPGGHSVEGLLEQESLDVVAL